MKDGDILVGDQVGELLVEVNNNSLWSWHFIINRVEGRRHPIR